MEIETWIVLVPPTVVATVMLASKALKAYVNYRTGRMS